MTNLSLVRQTVNSAFVTLATAAGCQAPTSGLATEAGNQYLGLVIVGFLVVAYLLVRAGAALTGLVDGLARAVVRLAGVAIVLMVVAVILVVALARLIGATAS